MKPIVELLRANQAFRYLWLAEAGSYFGSWFNTVAVLSLLMKVNHSGVTLSLFFLSRALPGILLGPFMGALIDRLPRRVLLIAMDVTRVGLSLGYILVRGPEDVWMAYLTAAAMGIADSIFDPAWRATIPRVVAAEDLPVANALSSATFALTLVLGAAFGGTLSTLLSPAIGFVVNSLSFAFSAFLVLLTRLPEQSQEAARPTTYWHDIREGFAAVRDIPVALGCVLVGISWGLAGGGYSILVSYVGSVGYNLGALGIGLLYTVDGIGVMVGSWLVGTWIRDNLHRALTWFGTAYLLQGLFFALFAALSTPILGVPAFFVMRVAGGIIIPLDSALLQRTVPSNLLGRVFSLHSATYGGVMQLSMLWTGFMVDSMGAQLTGTILGVVASVGGMGWLWALRAGKLSLGAQQKVAPVQRS